MFSSRLRYVNNNSFNEIFYYLFQVYSRDSKHRSDSLDEASQFSDLDDQLGTSPAHRPQIEKDLDQTITKVTEIKTITTTITDRKETRDQTLEFLKYESEHSSQVLGPALGQKDSDKVAIELCLLNN